MAIRKIIKRATDALFTNPEFDGTQAARQVKGTTAERTSAEAGDLRFNTTTSLLEYYDGVQWKSIDTPPTVSSISPTTESDPNANIVITGSNFASSVTVKFVGNDGTEYASPSVTRDSNTQITATTPATALSVANEPYDVVVTNTSSSLSGTLSDALDAGGVPAFNTSAGTYTIYDSERSSYSFDAGAVDPDGDTITYSISAGSLPSGASINSSTGAITGFSAVGSNTTSTFTVSAATSSDTSTRQFSIVVSAPVITSYTSVGSGTFSVPSGVTAVDVLVVAGGGGTCPRHSGGGGGGGLIYRPQFPVTPGGSVSYTVGAGGQGLTETEPPGEGPNGYPGDNSSFGTLTAQGGGAASFTSGQTGSPGGSGGGPGYYTTTKSNGTQPQQPGDSGTYGFGNQSGHSSGIVAGGGGGGAGQAGSNAIGPAGNGGAGGAGKAYSISGSSVYYAGGGGASSHPGTGNAAGGDGGQGGGGYGGGPNRPSAAGQQGQANRGGGGGGCYNDQGGSARGGSGIVIVSY